MVSTPPPPPPLHTSILSMIFHPSANFAPARAKKAAEGRWVLARPHTYRALPPAAAWAAARTPNSYTTRYGGYTLVTPPSNVGSSWVETASLHRHRLPPLCRARKAGGFLFLHGRGSPHVASRARACWRLSEPWRGGAQRRRGAEASAHDGTPSHRMASLYRTRWRPRTSGGGCRRSAACALGLT
jgi:hypothetical protein